MSATPGYRWSVLGLCEVRWRNSGETTTQDGHKLYFSGKEDRPEKGVGFLVHKDAVNTVIGCQPISSRLITIRLRATPFNITVVQAYAPTTDYDDEKIEGFYEQLQEVVDQIPKKDILIVQGDWNAKVGKHACKNWKYTCGLYSNKETNERGLKLLEFASLNDLKLANTFDPHKTSRRWTWHSPNGKHHNQIDYIMIKRRFQTSVNIAKTRSFPGADIGSDHDLVMMTFKLHLKKVSKQGHSRIRFDLEKLRDPEVAETFKAMIAGKFAPLTLLDADDVNMDDLINKFNVAVTETANETLGMYRHHKQPWVTPNILHLCNKRRELKKDKFTTEGAKQYKAVNQQIKKGMVKARETWTEERCQETDDSLGKNNNKKAYQLVKDLTSSKQGRTTTIQDKNGKRLTEDRDILNRWTEYCSELYNHKAKGDPEVLKHPPVTNIDSHPILREEVEAAVKSLKPRKSAGVDNIPAELLQAGGETMIDVLLNICKKIWQTGQRPAP